MAAAAQLKWVGLPQMEDEREKPEVRERLSGPAMRAFLALSDTWELAIDQRRALLGWPAESTYFKYRSGNVGMLTYDQLTRISLVLGIYKALHTLYAEQAMADRWIKLPNSNAMFGGQPPLHLMTAAGMDGLYQVRRLLDSRCAG